MLEEVSRAELIANVPSWTALICGCVRSKLETDSCYWVDI